LLEQRPQDFVVSQHQRNRLDGAGFERPHELRRKECLPHQVHSKPARLCLHHDDVLVLQHYIGLACDHEWTVFDDNAVEQPNAG